MRQTRHDERHDVRAGAGTAGPGAHRPAPGATTLTQQLGAGAPTPPLFAGDAAWEDLQHDGEGGAHAASAGGGDDENNKERVRGSFDKMGASWVTIQEGRHDAIDRLEQEVAKDDRKVAQPVLLQAASLALSEASSAIGGKIAVKAGKVIFDVFSDYVLDKTNSALKNKVLEGSDKVERARNFADRQRGALNAAISQIKQNTIDARTNAVIAINDHKVSSKTAVRQAEALAISVHNQEAGANALQYRASLDKWLSALAQDSLGQDKASPPSAPTTKLSDDQHTRGVGGSVRSNYGQAEGEGYVHLEIDLASDPGVAFRVKRADIPGVSDNALKLSGFADTPLGHRALPVMVDAILHLPVTETNLRSSNRNPLQPVSMVMNERKQVSVKLQDPKGNDYIRPEDVTWAAQQFAKIRNQRTAQATAETIMKNEVATKSLRALKVV